MHRNRTIGGPLSHYLRLTSFMVAFIAILSAASPLLAQDYPYTTAYPPPATYEGARAVSLSCNSLTFCSGTYYCLGTDCTPTTPYSSPVTISASTDLRYYSTDRAGGTEAVQTGHYAIVPDTRAPSTTAYPASGTFGPRLSVYLYCYDNNGSGCKNTYYCLGTGCTPDTAYPVSDPPMPGLSVPIPTSPISLTSSTDIRFYSEDNAGNAGAVGTESYHIDTTPPVTSATPAGGSYDTPPAVTLSCVDTETRCANTYYCLGNGCSPSTPYTAPVTINDSSAVLRFYSRDNGGNAETVREESYANGNGAPRTLAVPAGYATIQSAIDAAFNGDSVLVAAGTYRENINFKGKNITVSSSDGAGATVIDGNAQGTVVTFKGGEGRDAVLSGFTIRNGSGGFDGGGIYIYGSSPTITDNTIAENHASRGGGIEIDSGSPSIRNNTITRNRG